MSRQFPLASNFPHFPSHHIALFVALACTCVMALSFSRDHTDETARFGKAVENFTGRAHPRRLGSGRRQEQGCLYPFKRAPAHRLRLARRQGHAGDFGIPIQLLSSAVDTGWRANCFHKPTGVPYVRCKLGWVWAEGPQGGCRRIGCLARSEVWGSLGVRAEERYGSKAPVVRFLSRIPRTRKWYGVGRPSKRSRVISSSREMARARLRLFLGHMRGRHVAGHFVEKADQRLLAVPRSG